MSPATLGTRKDSAERVSAYAELAPRLHGLLADERDAIAAMANVGALLMEDFRWHWVGFYRVVGDELVLGPFQGPVACSRIAYGKGVCGTAWKEERTVVVADVDRFPGHIACSAHSRSEIVVPVRGRSGRIAAVLDIDSALLDDFGDVDARALEAVCETLQPFFE